jgi:hypothetical protein
MLQITDSSKYHFVIRASHNIFQDDKLWIFIGKLKAINSCQFSITLEGTLDISSERIKHLIFKYKIKIYWVIEIFNDIDCLQQQSMCDLVEFGIPVFLLMKVSSIDDIDSVNGLLRKLLPLTFYSGFSVIPSSGIKDNKFYQCYVQLLSQLYQEYPHFDVCFSPLKEVVESVANGCFRPNSNLPRTVLCSINDKATDVSVNGVLWKSFTDILGLAKTDLYEDIYNRFFSFEVGNSLFFISPCQFSSICSCVNEANIRGIDIQLACDYQQCFVSSFLWQKFFLYRKLGTPIDK